MSHAPKFRKSRKSTPQTLPPQATAPPQAGLNYVDAEVAAFLRLKNPRTLAVWRARGTHPLKPVAGTRGGRVLYRGQDIIDFLAGKTTKKRGAK